MINLLKYKLNKIKFKRYKFKNYENIYLFKFKLL